MDEGECSNRIIRAAIEVHRTLGPGLLESAYEAALAHQLQLDGLSIERQRPLAISYKGLELSNAYRIDLIVMGMVMVEVKSVDTVLPIHRAQLLTYLRLANVRLGLLLNFNALSMRDGIRRVANRLKERPGMPAMRRSDSFAIFLFPFASFASCFGF